MRRALRPAVRLCAFRAKRACRWVARDLFYCIQSLCVVRRVLCVRHVLHVLSCVWSVCRVHYVVHAAPVRACAALCISVCTAQRRRASGAATAGARCVVRDGGAFFACRYVHGPGAYTCVYTSNHRLHARMAASSVLEPARCDSCSCQQQRAVVALRAAL